VHNIQKSAPLPVNRVSP